MTYHAPFLWLKPARYVHADVPGSEEDELIPSSNMDSFLGGYIPSSSFYSKVGARLAQQGLKPRVVLNFSLN